MKKQTLFSAITGLFIWVVLFAGSPLAASAQSQSDSIAFSDPVIRYLGADASFYYLQVQVDNPSMGKIQVALKDQTTGSLIFEAIFTDRYFLQTVAVPRNSRLLQWLVNCRAVKGRGLEDLVIW